MSSVNERNTLIFSRKTAKPESLLDDSLPHDGERNPTGEIVSAQQAVDARLAEHTEHERQVAGFLFSLGFGYTKVAWVTGMNINTMRDWERAFKAGKFRYEAKNRRYSETHKSRAVELRKKGSEP